MFSQTSEQAPSTGPVISPDFSQKEGLETVSPSWRRTKLRTDDRWEGNISQLAPPRYSQPIVAPHLRAAPLVCD